MTIKQAEKLPKDAVPVFLIHEGEPVARHFFFSHLDAHDREYISLIQKKLNIQAGVSRLVFLPGGRKALVLGIEKRNIFSHRKAILLARRAIAVSRTERIPHIALATENFRAPQIKDESELAEIVAAQMELANFEFVKYRTPPTDGWFFVKTASLFSKTKSDVNGAILRGTILGEEINKARALSNTPGGDMTPSRLAEAAKKSGRETGFKTTVLDLKKMRRLKMGGVLGVAKGSSEAPQFIIMEYLKGKKGERPVVLVGKGVTFDTGGLNLKPEHGIYEMHMDMSGGAAVVHAIAALARLKVKKNIIGLVPAVENMPSGSSYHPGDQLKTMSGKTIEVLNTDAEGRVILADALTYAKRYNPKLVIDIATLTGSAMSALGQRASAIFTTAPELERALRETGEKTGDFVWPLPLWEEYEEEIKGTFGDFANTGKTRYGGAITGAVFLWQFIKDSSTLQSDSGQVPWIHIDIAPRMTTIEGEFLAKGAAGASIALLAHFLREF